MTRLPKSQPFTADGFELTWWTKNYVTKREYMCSAYYPTQEMAERAFAIAQSQKTKTSVRLIKLTPCPDTLEKQQEIYRDKGGNWDHHCGRYLYSASY